MIIQKTQYTDEDKAKIEKIYKDLGSEAEYMGEEGNMVCRATTPRGALIKFKRRVVEDCGYADADEMDLDAIGIGYIFLVTEEDKKEGRFDDSEWYVDYGGGHISDYPVYTFVI